ncbi:MAG: N-acetylglucosamine-6-phosphate deacetylase [Candidatus Cohnella colombiensis]|uniref:N-acetylglucosamine-6-phosphate deacetylase n=1 Tax=Candidatus Cohnella colombiensis TaxID=3121368 RepID=A0AA95JC37_9BACL|nr:MAG: N-acetylglucosamine-6-phosphate deacetylase [Cohnella sp.]
MSHGTMGNLLIHNARVVAPDATIENGWVLLNEGIIVEVGSGEIDLTRTDTAMINAAGMWLIPGFIDVHVHGGAGSDFMSADADGLSTITKFHATHGTTSIVATSLTASREELTAILDRTHHYMSKAMPYAQVVGVHLEGPFVSEKWRGAQNPAFIAPPQLAWLEEWVSRYPDLIKLQTLAPETEGALDYIERLTQLGIVASCGHTDATYEEIIASADRGLRQATHTFNAMRSLHHREPGTVGAVLTDSRIRTEVIADGHHVHHAAIKLLVAAKGRNGVILITDAMEASGMPDGDYKIGELPVQMIDGVARLKDSGNLAGSTLTMIQAFRYMVNKVGVSVEDASQMASGNPANQLGIDAVTGSITSGKRGDLLLLDDTLTLHNVWIGGRPHSL